MNWLKRIFPPANELTVFVVTVTILSMFLYMDGWMDKAGLHYVEFVGHASGRLSAATGVIDYILFCFALLFVVALFVVMIFGPLLLPFVRQDLRGIGVFMLLVDASVITYGNMMVAREAPSLLNSLIALYGVAWVFYIYAAGKGRCFDYLMTRDKFSSASSVFAACISVIAVFVAVEVYSVHWARAYSMGSIFTSIVFVIVAETFVGRGEGRSYG